jgi:Fic family protein
MMRYIHEHPHWPSVHWDNELLVERLAYIRNKQGLLLGRMSSLGFEIKAEANLEVLTANIIKSSAIEGEQLDAQQIRSSLAKKLGLDTGGLPPSNRHIDGIVELMLDATQKYNEPLTEDRLFDWHCALFPTLRSGLRFITVGTWRPVEAGAMQVVSGARGREKVHYEAPNASRLPEEMHAFLDWLNHTKNIDPVIRAGVAHFWFVTIHPFEDGNGRVARAIADMCLAKADNKPERFYSMSAQIEKERKQYYIELETAQKGTPDITGWLQWFLDCLGRAIDGADETLETVLYKANIWNTLSPHPVNERQRKVINRLLDNFKGKLTCSKYAKLAKCSHDTALRDIKKRMALCSKKPVGGVVRAIY